MRYQLDGSGYQANARANEIMTGCAEGSTKRCIGYELIRDLDFMDDASYSSTPNKVTWTTGKGWQPIGYYEYYNSPNNESFKAMFEGNNHTIFNLMINRPDTNYIGLFGYTERRTGTGTGTGTKIANVGLLDVKIKGNSRVGGLVGYSRGTITNSHAAGSVEGSDWNVGGLVGVNIEGKITDSYATSDVAGEGHDVGGLVGRNWRGTITNSYATGAVAGGRSVGGLVGRNWDGTITNNNATGSVRGGNYVGGLVGRNYGTITNSYATGAVVAGDSWVGGLVGWNFVNGTITNSYATGAVAGRRGVGGLVGWNDFSNITNSYATGNVTGSGNYAGGLVGGNYRGTITNSYATGAVTGGWLVGGLVGRNASGSEITNSYAVGSVTGSGDVGGLVGSSPGAITNSYATGAVGWRGVGGLVGASSGDITNSYWDTQTSGITSGNNGVGYTTTELQLPTDATGIYADWGNTDWYFGTSKQYPDLKYAKGPDADNPACGTAGQPACGILLSGQRIGLLEQLAVSTGTLSPLFNPKTYSYDVTVNYNEDNITLYTTATGAAIRITSNTMEKEYSKSNTSIVTIPLTITGGTIITIAVSKGRAEEVYTVTVTHNLLAPDNPDGGGLHRIEKILEVRIAEGEEFNEDKKLSPYDGKRLINQISMATNIAFVYHYCGRTNISDTYRFRSSR